MSFQVTCSSIEIWWWSIDPSPDADDEEDDDWLVVSNICCFHNMLGIILPIDELIFFKMVKTTNQTKTKMMMMMMNLFYADHYYLTNSLNRRVAVSMPEASESYSQMSHVWSRYLLLLSFYRQWPKCGQKYTFDSSMDLPNFVGQGVKGAILKKECEEKTRI